MTKKLLQEFGLPVPRGLIVESPEEAINAARKLGFPVVIKPLRGRRNIYWGAAGGEKRCGRPGQRPEGFGRPEGGGSCPGDGTRGILRAGLAYDRADVGIVLNVSEDHLGQYGVETLEDLAHVKSLVVETVKEDGFLVLNADDPLTLRMRAKARGKIILFSLDGNNPAVVEHLACGGMAVYTQAGCIFIARGSLKKKLIAVPALTCTFKGLARHNLQNALAAVAACWALNIPFPAIARGLREFGRVPEHNPGRLMFKIMTAAAVAPGR